MKNIAVFFGGVSVEHDVSVITGVLTVNSLDKEKYTGIPVYIEDGTWYTGEELFDVENYKDLDLKKLIKLTFVSGSPVLYKVVKNKKLVPYAVLSAGINCLHGERGEDGALSGLLKMNGVPLASPDMLASSISMDKCATKIFLNGLRVRRLPYLCTSDILESKKFANKIGYPVIVKPAKLGSSIGINTANDEKSLSVAVSEGLRYGSKVIIEKKLTDFTEINCSAYIKKDGSVRVSECERPVGKTEVLSFSDKYSDGEREFPAKIPEELANKIKRTTERVYRATSCTGIIRIDYFISDGKIYLNEINSVPGSLAYYLFSDTLKGFSEILTEQIELAERNFAKESTFVKKFGSSILNIKGIKGAKRL